MCGIAGAIGIDHPLACDRLKAMVDVIHHRGPDDAGYLLWQSGAQHPRGDSFGESFTDSAFQRVSPLLPTLDSAAGQEMLMGTAWDVFLGHRRLAILDLSARGHQPMGDETRRVWVSYNGEIYNFQALRAELVEKGYAFRTQTDTEVLVHGYKEWGFAETIKRLNGMFALALWDAATGELHLARDRCGIKPLYCCTHDGVFLFASEIKSILRYTGGAEVDLLAFNEYFSFQNVFSERTLFAGVEMLPAGHLLTVRPGQGPGPARQYWDFAFGESVDLVDPRTASAALREAMERAVARQCVADVPVGSYLSGGMDSGTVTALAARQIERIRTFTLGFDLSEAMAHEQHFDERELAELMASTFQTEHYECVLHAGDMAAVMSDLIWHLEDLRVGQCYPNYYVSRLASRFVRVVLSGAGGDELFGGYPWRYAAAVHPTATGYVQNYYNYWKRLISNSDKRRHAYQDGVVAALETLDADGAVPFRDHTLRTFERVFRGLPEVATAEAQIDRSLYFECKTFLHGLLVVEDKLSMAHSLETRLPFLDNELVDLACRIPVRLKVPAFQHLQTMDENEVRKKERVRMAAEAGKSVLRKSMEQLLPPSITGARKQGFSAPDESWFRGAAEEYVRATLLDPAARSQQYFKPSFTRAVIEEHSRGERNRRLLIWSLLCFEHWLHLFDV